MTEESEKSVGRRGRGRIADPERTAATRAAILAAAAAVFTEQGFERARMTEVARRAGVAKGTLYLYFDTKEALFEGVLRDALTLPFDWTERAPEPDQSIRDFLLGTVLPSVRMIEESGRIDLLRLVMREGARFPEVAESYRRVVLEPGMRAVAALARRARAGGELQTDALERLPILLAAPAVTATMWNGMFPDRPIGLAEAFEAFIGEVFAEQPEG